MQRIIDVEYLICNEILKYLPATPAAQAFQEKYVNPDMNFTIESDMSAALAECEMQAFYAGYRTAMAVVSGAEEVNLSELLKKS